MKEAILVTGGQGRFAKILKKNNKVLNLYFANKKECNILNIKSLEKIIKKIKPKIIIQTAGLSRPMKIHEKNTLQGKCRRKPPKEVQRRRTEPRPKED